MFSSDLTQPDHLQAFLNSFQTQIPDPTNIYSVEDRLFKNIMLSGDPESDSSNSCSHRSSPDHASYSSTADEIDDNGYSFALGPYMQERRVQRQERQIEKKRKTCGVEDVSFASNSAPSASFALAPVASEKTGTVPEAELKRRRLARKAELARESRKRKNGRIEELEAQVLELQTQLEAKTASASSPPSAPSAAAVNTPGSPQTVLGCLEKVTIAVQQADSQLDLAIRAVVATDPSQQCSAAVRQVYESFTNKLLLSHVLGEQARVASKACLPVAFVHWVLAQSDKFYRDPSGLWSSLFMQELAATPSQLDRLLALRRSVQGPASPDAGSGVAPASPSSELCLADQKRLMEGFLQTFSPQQLVLFFHWVEKFGAVCIKIKL